MWLQRIMMCYLRRRGWVVFYLEERARTCNGDTCWMKMYQAQLKGDAKSSHNWFRAKFDPNTDEGKFMHSFGQTATSNLDEFVKGYSWRVITVTVVAISIAIALAFLFIFGLGWALESYL